jgi:porphobilinogen synthase
MRILRSLSGYSTLLSSPARGRQTERRSSFDLSNSFRFGTPARISLSVEELTSASAGGSQAAALDFDPPPRSESWCLMAFPIIRMRRLRRTAQLRDMVRETRLTPEAFVYPLFVCPGEGVRKAVGSMPGVFNLSVDEAVKEAREVHSLGVPSVILFGLPDKKDDVATGAWVDDGIVQQAARAIKREVPDLVLMGDVCLCEYMSHGHCGIVKGAAAPKSLGAAVAEPPTKAGSVEGKNKNAKSSSGEFGSANYEIDNDASLELLARTSVSQTRAGIDIIAPSDMMDGRVAAIRRALDEARFINTPILSYAAKFASGFYGPFREAADSAPQFGDRRSYQMDGANLREAMREIELDIEEGADMIMVKPAMPYLDVIAAARQRFDLPLAAYQVSGEYAMIEAAARNGWIERDRVMMESLLSIRRAGASIILTYHAKDAARLLA